MPLIILLLYEYQTMPNIKNMHYDIIWQWIMLFHYICEQLLDSIIRIV